MQDNEAADRIDVGELRRLVEAAGKGSVTYALFVRIMDRMGASPVFNPDGKGWREECAKEPSHTAMLIDQIMVPITEEAQADLLAENERLREALAEATRALDDFRRSGRASKNIETLIERCRATLSGDKP